MGTHCVQRKIHQTHNYRIGNSMINQTPVFLNKSCDLHQSSLATWQKNCSCAHDVSPVTLITPGKIWTLITSHSIFQKKHDK